MVPGGCEGLELLGPQSFQQMGLGPEPMWDSTGDSSLDTSGSTGYHWGQTYAGDPLSTDLMAEAVGETSGKTILAPLWPFLPVPHQEQEFCPRTTRPHVVRHRELMEPWGAVTEVPLQPALHTLTI